MKIILMKKEIKIIVIICLVSMQKREKLKIVCQVCKRNLQKIANVTLILYASFLQMIIVSIGYEYITIDSLVYNHQFMT